MSSGYIFAENVRKGAIIMDGYHGGIGWVDFVSTETLDMSDSFNCVLGQYFGNFGEGMQELGLTPDEIIEAYGFDALRVDLSRVENYALLEIAWIAEINARRGLTTDAVDYGECAEPGCCI
jgi:hypothetical protein